MQGVLGMNDDKSQVMNTLLRMVVPIRREFGRNLDVKHFLHDLEYQQDIIRQALQSQDTRLRDYAQYVQKLMSGPRAAANAPAPPRAEPVAAADSSLSAASKPPFAETVIPTSGGPSTLAEPRSKEDDLRDKIMRKYTSGLR
jgi:hypothetical protein